MVVTSPDRRGTVISAVLSWSPMSSDCAFIPMGCSVSSRYTFPYGAWLGVICLGNFTTNKTTQASINTQKFIMVYWHLEQVSIAPPFRLAPSGENLRLFPKSPLEAMLPEDFILGLYLLTFS